MDISCYQITPYKLDERTLLDVQKILPLQAQTYSDFYLGFKDNSLLQKSTKRAVKQKLPRIGELLEANVVKPEDVLYPKNHKGEQDCYVELQENGLVKTNDGKIISLQAWLKSVYGWSAVETYSWTMHAETDKPLSKLREEYVITKKTLENSED